MNKTSDYKLTIIIPIFNEEDNMIRLEETLKEYLPGCSVKACAMLVNDGSKDKSLEMMKKICEKVPDVYYISFADNRGLSAAMKAGIDVSFSEYVGYMDADMQTDIHDFDVLLSYIPDYALVTGIRADRKDSNFKKLQSKMANSFRRMMTSDGATDAGCPLKVLKTEYAQRIPFFTGMPRFLPALIKLKKDGDFYVIPIRPYPRTAGASKFNL